MELRDAIVGNDEGNILISKVSARMQGASIANLCELFSLVRAGWGRKIEAIKKTREITGCGIAEGKAFVEHQLTGSAEE